MKGCEFRLDAHQKLQLCLAFGRSTTPIPVKRCKMANPCECKFMHWTPPIPVKCCKVRALDHANPCEGLQVAPLYFVTLPRVRAFDYANPCEWLQMAYGDVSLYLAFVRSTTRIPVNGSKCA